MREKFKESTVKTERRTKDGIDYSYELTVKESTNLASYRLPLYSVAVKMESFDGEIATSEKSDVFADAGKALAFFDMLVENLATPIDLPYIIEDEF